MKLWLIRQNSNRNYDTYDSILVCYGTEEEARMHNPEGSWAYRFYSTWCEFPHQVSVEYIGEAADHVEKGSVISSFNAG